jgi:hypothetical protein
MTTTNTPRGTSVISVGDLEKRIEHDRFNCSIGALCVLHEWLEDKKAMEKEISVLRETVNDRVRFEISQEKEIADLKAENERVFMEWDMTKEAQKREIADLKMEQGSLTRKFLIDDKKRRGEAGMTMILTTEQKYLAVELVSFGCSYLILERGLLPHSLPFLCLGFMMAGGYFSAILQKRKYKPYVDRFYGRYSK